MTTQDKNEDRNKDTLRRFHGAYASGDANAIRACLAADSWCTASRPATPATLTAC